MKNAVNTVNTGQVSIITADKRMFLHVSDAVNDGYGKMLTLIY